MKKILLSFVLLLNMVWAKECSPYYNPQKFYEVPELLAEFIDEHIKAGKIFASQKAYKGFEKSNDNYRLEKSFITQGDYVYPIKNGVWQYKLKNHQLDEINIARVELYRFADEEIAQSINDDFEYFWRDFIEDGYSMQLTPEQTLFRYNDEYFSFSVFIHGVIGDTTPLKGTVVNFWFKNYTHEVNEFIKCNKSK